MRNKHLSLEICKQNMEYPDKEKIHDIMRRMVQSDSLRITFESGDDSVSTNRPANKYLHYELGENPGENVPVEHEEADMIPVTDDSVVVAIWTEDGRRYERYYDNKKFKEKFF
jgi:hypothetical protein